jgi:hypothetical protein
MPMSTADMTEKKGITNGETNGDTNGEYVIPCWIPQEPVSMARKPWIPPKDSKLLHPGRYTYNIIRDSALLVTLLSYISHRNRTRQHRPLARNAPRHPRQ